MMKALFKLIMCVQFFALGANATQLVHVAVPTAVYNAVETIYDKGRHESDTGGLSAVAHYKNPLGLKTFQIVKYVMFGQHAEASAKWMAEITCKGIKINNCVRMVLENDEYVQANHQYNDLFSFIDDMFEWGFEDDFSWKHSLATVKVYTENFIGENYRAYSFGYDDIADVFTIILISEDKEDIIVYTGDLGA